MQQFMTQLINPSQLLHNQANQAAERSNNVTHEEKLFNNARRVKADVPKPPTLNLVISLGEFSKWRKACNDYVIVSQAQELPPSSEVAL